MTNPSRGSTPPDDISNQKPKIEVREIHHYHDQKFERWEKRITAALSLIVIGFVLFLNTTGNLDWSVWLEFIKFWPVLLISLGISLILSFSRVSKIIAEFISFFIFVIVLFFAAVNTNSGIFANSNIPSPKVNTFFPFISLNKGTNGTLKKHDEINISQYQGVTSMALKLDQGVGTFDLNSLNSDNVYLTADVFSNSSDDGLDLTSTLNNNVLTAGITSTTTNHVSFFNRAPDYQYRVSNQVKALDLDLNLGAGQGHVNLGDEVKCNNLVAKSGAGELTMRFTAASLCQNMDFNVGAGSMELNIPRGTGYEVVYHIGVGNISFEGKHSAAGLGVNKTYRSENYNASGSNLRIVLNVGAGNFTINTF